MNTSLIIVIQIILLIMLAYFVYVIIKENRIMNIEKRINKYSLASIDDYEEPLFEKIYKNTLKIIKKLSKLLLKSEVLKKYSKHYEKYISGDDINRTEAIDFISIKFIISFLLGLLYIISTLIRIKYDFCLLLIILILGFFIFDIYLKILYKKRRKYIEDDLLNAIIIMNNAFKSGMNIMQAVDIVKSELTGPIQDEFKKISIDISYGLSLEFVFDRFYKRVNIEDANYITSSISLINKTGGNIVRVFNAIEKNFYDKKKLKDEMNSLTSSSIFMFRLLTIMPIILVLVIYTLNPSYFNPLFTTYLGRGILLLVLILYIIYIFIVKKILKVDV